MDRKAAKELMHIDGWLDRSGEIVERGRDAYLADDLLQEAGDCRGTAVPHRARAWLPLRRRVGRHARVEREPTVGQCAPELRVALRGTAGVTRAAAWTRAASPLRWAIVYRHGEHRFEPTQGRRGERRISDVACGPDSLRR